MGSKDGVVVARLGLRRLKRSTWTGTTSQGETQAEALRNLTEATALYLEEFPLPLGERPVVMTFHIADVA